MRKKTKIISIVVVLILLILAACQGNSTESTSNLNETPSPIAETKDLVVATITQPETPTPTAETKDLVFATIIQPEAEELVLDVYTPEGEGLWPVVVFLHGLQGTKDGYIVASRSIADQGIVVFTINWPTWLIDMAIKDNGKGFREMYEVISCSIHYARAKAEDYHGDPSKVVLVGHSYGASNGAWVALGSDKLETLWEEYAATHGGPLSQVECVENSPSAHIDAFIGVAGPYNWISKLQDRDPEIWKLVSPYAFLETPLDLPIHLIHGEQDDVVLPEVSGQFNDALLAAGFNTKLIMHDGSHKVPIDLTISELLAVLEEIEE